MIGLLLGALILGVIISVMEDDFPDFLPLLGCVVVVFLASWGAAIAIGDTQSILLSFVPLIVGAFAGGIAISAFIGMTVKRATIAAASYLGVQLAFALIIALVFGS